MINLNKPENLEIKDNKSEEVFEINAEQKTNFSFGEQQNEDVGVNILELKQAVIEIKGVTKSFGKIKFKLAKIFNRDLSKYTVSSIKAVDNVDISIKQGEIYGLIGSNGAGKSTILKMLSGLIFADKGEITINGININKADARNQIGAIIEFPSFYNDMSALENLYYLADMQGGLPKKRILDIVKFVDLEKRINDKVSTYSLGMKQRLGIAQAIMHKPNVLILDEPTNGLDPDWIIKIRDLILKCSREYGMTVIVSSHILSEMQLICDRFGFIKNGKLIKECSKKELDELAKGDMNIYSIEVSNVEKAEELVKESFKDILTKVKDNKLFIKISDIDVSEINKVLIVNGFSIYSVNMKKRNLEDIFFQVTK